MTVQQTMKGALLVLLCAPAVVVGQGYDLHHEPTLAVPRHHGFTQAPTSQHVPPIIDGGIAGGSHHLPMPAPIVDPPLPEDYGHQQFAQAPNPLAPSHTDTATTEPNMQREPSAELVDSPEDVDPSQHAATQLTDPFDDDEWCLPRVWASAEYVLLWTEGANVPTLVTASVPGTVQEQAARLGLPATSVLFGGEELNGGARSGARFTLGGWLDLYNMFGVELTLLVLGNDETRFSASDEFGILGRPFFNLTGAEQDAKLTNFPGLVQGSLIAETKSEFHTGEALFRKRVAGWGASQVDWYLGYRNAGLIDDIRVLDSSTVLAGPAAGTVF